MFTFIFNFFTRSLVVLLVAMLSVNFMPNHLFENFPLEPKPFEPNNYDSVIPQWNTKLSDGKPEFIQLNNIVGPESLAISPVDGLIYTGLADGRLVELNPEKKYQVRTVLRMKQSANCKDGASLLADECGRILQIRFFNGTLYAIDANTGLYKIDPKSGTKLFVGPKPLTKSVFYNSFAFDPKQPNLVYVSVSSTKWNLLNIVWSILDHDVSGQIIALDIASGKRVTVADNLLMANGVAVDAKRDQLLASETMGGRVQTIPLGSVRTAFKAAKDGDKLKSVAMKPLVPLFPGNPDNIIIEGDLAYIALPFVKLNGKELIDHLGNMPSVRKALGRFLFGLGKLGQYVCNNFYHHPLLETTYREFMSGHIIYKAMTTAKSAVIEYNLATGSSRFLGSDTFGYVSEVVPDNKGNVLIGSFRSLFIVKQKI